MKTLCNIIFSKYIDFEIYETGLPESPYKNVGKGKDAMKKMLCNDLSLEIKIILCDHIFPRMLFKGLRVVFQRIFE